MVQRKVANKFGIRTADHVNPEKLLANLKPSSFQPKEIKNKGGLDLKMKMKKSGSFKKMKGPIGQPGKPPPIVPPEKHLATPMKPSPIKKDVMDTTPNYMKSTTSSDARNETGVQASSQTVSSDGKYSIRRKILNSNSKASSDFGNKKVRTLSRISSLKLVRTFTKTPSFKQTRISAGKCSSMILCENLHVQRATCSSTIKDHKFPDHLTFTVGATETEGTSTMKVCPYTYCSLNGHHHEPLPPLKSFLSARRRMLKAQRSIKIGCLSPRRTKPTPQIVNEIEADQRGPHIQPPPFEEGSLIQEMNPGFFVEIYSQKREDPSQMNQHTTNEDFPEEDRNSAVGEKLYPPDLDQGITELEFLNFVYALVENSTPSIKSEEEYSEKYDMEEAEEVHCDGSYPGGAKLIKIYDMIDLQNANSVLDSFLLDDVIVTKDEAVIEDGEKSLPDEILQEAIYNDFEAGSGAEDDSEFTSSHQNMSRSSGTKCKDQSQIRFKVEEAISVREDGDNEESDYHEDDTVFVHSAFNEKAVDETCLTNMGKGASEPEDWSSMELKATIDQDSQQVMTPEIEDSYDVGTSIFEYPHDISKNMTEKLSKSIGTQTDNECEDQQDMQGNMVDEVHKRSIGTQTEFEDHDLPGALIESPNYVNAQLDGGQVVPVSKDSKEDTFFQMEQTANECTNQTVSEDINNQLCSISIEDNTMKSESSVGLSEPAEQDIYKIQMGVLKEESNSAESSAHEEITDTCKRKKGTSRVIEENNGEIEFNPRAPNFLPVEADPEAEKVDLRHLTLDERKNSEEWMVDHAIQRAVTKLAPDRKRKVALLVEAFETVSPSTKCEFYLRHDSIASSQPRIIQACS